MSVNGGLKWPQNKGQVNDAIQGVFNLLRAAYSVKSDNNVVIELMPDFGMGMETVISGIVNSSFNILL